MIMIWRSGWLLVIAGACAAAPEVSETSEIEQHGLCSPRTCGVNSPEIDHMGFHELEMTGAVPNDEGFQLHGLWKDGVRYELQVRGAVLTGLDPRGARQPLAGRDLIGAGIFISHGSSRYVIRVTDVGAMEFPVEPFGQVETYTLDYTAMSGQQPINEWKNICGAVPIVSPPGDPEYGWHETFGQKPVESILFEGDRIDMASKTMSARPDPRWFNIGCAGHTLAKLFLTHNTIASQRHWEEHHRGRQATLKLLTADYCGTGRAFTVAGQKLVWKGGGMTYMAGPHDLEARWNEHGATCIGAPRMRTPTSKEGEKQFPNIDKMIASECRIPSCENIDPQELGEALRVSGNY